MENNKKYCIYCGAENKPADKFCHKCGESFDYKDDELQTYAKDKIKGKITDEAKSKATDTLLDMLKKFLNSKAYGVILSLSVIASAGYMLTGTDKINEFSNNIPGMFIDGSVYGVTFDSSEYLVESGVNLIGKHDGSGNIYMLYLEGSTSYYSDYYITVTGFDGRIIRQDQLLHYDQYTENSTDYLVAVEDLYCTVEIKYDMLNEDRTNTTTVKLNGPVGIKSLTEYENDILMLSQKFYDNGTEEYSYRVSGYTLLDDGSKEYSIEETYYNEEGEILSFVEKAGDTVVKTKIREDYTDGSYKYTFTYNGLTDDINVFDSQDRIVEDYAFTSGSFMFKKVYEYYETGEVMSLAFFNEENNEHPRSVEYYNTDGTLKQEIVYDQFTGTVRSDTVYDGNGSAVKNTYYTDIGQLLSVTYLQQRDDGIYDPVRVVQYDRSGNITSDETRVDTQ